MVNMTTNLNNVWEDTAMPSSRELALIHSLKDLMMNNNPPPQTEMWMKQMIVMFENGDSPVKSVTDADDDKNLAISETLYKRSERKM